MDYPGFLKVPDAPKPCRRIVAFEFLPEPKHFKRSLGPVMWSTFDLVFISTLVAFISFTLALLVVPR